MRVFAMMSDSDIEPFTSGQDDDECLPRPEDPSTESDSEFEFQSAYSYSGRNERQEVFHQASIGQK